MKVGRGMWSCFVVCGMVVFTRIVIVLKRGNSSHLQASDDALRYRRQMWLKIRHENDQDDDDFSGLILIFIIYSSLTMHKYLHVNPAAIM